MTRDQFNRLLQNPATIDLNFVGDLEDITREFPYFTNAHLLLAKQYHGHENIRYENYLRKASAYAPDRTVLYQLIRTAPLEIVHIREPERNEERETETERSEETVSPNLTHSFLDWLKIKSVPVIPAEELADFLLRDKGYDEVNESIKRPTDMIEKFIQGEPRIIPKKSEFYSPGNMARASAMEPEDLVSETLARIYAQQGNIPKAIEAYLKLSLKFPEKSSYFAALIQELEGQQNSE